MTFLLIALLGISAQSTGFAGTWIAEHQGTVFARLEIRNVQGTLQGAFGIGNITVDKQGNVDKASQVPTPLTNLARISATQNEVRFFLDDGDEFGLRVLDAGRAELIFYPSKELIEEIKAEGIPMPAPIVLRRER